MLQASFLPEMKKDTVYKVQMFLESSSYAIVGAVCGCKAGQGPKGSCKHFGPLHVCYAFAEFCRYGKLPEFISSTQKLQEWNQPQSRRVEVILSIDLSSQRQEILKKDTSIQSPVPSVYDPRPHSMCSPDSDSLEELYVNVLIRTVHCVLTQLLVPPVQKALGDHGGIRNCEDENCTDSVTNLSTTAA